MAFLAACESSLQPDSLPQGVYPLQIGNVSFTAEVTEQPWTRVSESADGQSSVWDWDGSEMIGVQLGDETAIYTLNADKTLTSDRQLYWQSTAPATVTAWYPTSEEVSLANQTTGLAYVLRAFVPNAQYNDPVSLQFIHQLAKVRVTLSGTQAGQVDKVEVNNYTACTHTQGDNVTPGTAGWITMHKVDATTYEANVVPVTSITPDNFIRLNGTAIANVSGISTLQAATMYTIGLTVNSSIPADAQEIPANGTINDNGNYVVRGTRNTSINITGDNPTIYLENANISAPTPIRITGNSTATICVTGGNSAVTSTSGTGMIVEKGSTLIITSESTDNVITVRGKNNSSNDYPGIGGNESGDCGTIRIENVTVHAYGDGTFACAPGIGPSQNYSCEGIIIDEAVVYAYGTGSDNLAAPGIGSGMHNFSAEIGAIPKIEITHSTIHAVRGGVVADYIGRAGWTSDSASSEVNPGTGGSIKSSTVYCHTRDTYRLDKTMVYDASGNATQQ